LGRILELQISRQAHKAGVPDGHISTVVEKATAGKTRDWASAMVRRSQTADAKTKRPRSLAAWAEITDLRFQISEVL
jgi:hypothetical protein